MNFSITRNGKPLNPTLYVWDEETKTLLTEENGLVLDFSGITEATFKTGQYCVFKTGNRCTFNTSAYCVFKAGSCCIFNTSFDCTFNVGSANIFKTGERCVIIRRDVYEVIKIPENTKIKLNGYGIKGYTIIPAKETIKIGGQEYYKDEVEKRIKELKPVV